MDHQDQSDGIDRIDFFPHNLYRFKHMLLKGFKPEIRESYGLTETQMRTLMFIKRQGPRPMSSVVCYMNLEKGSMTAVVDRLIEKDLVRRERDKADRRRVIIDLTEKGRELASRAYADLNSHINGRLDELGPGLKQELIRSLDLIRQSIEIWETKE